MKQRIVLLAALAALVLIAFGAWTYGLSQGRGNVSGRALQGMAAVSVAGVVALAIVTDLNQPAEMNMEAASSKAESEAFSQQKLDMLLASGQPVFVNMAAAWCITCLVNERTALSTDAVREVFAGKRICTTTTTARPRRSLLATGPTGIRKSHAFLKSSAAAACRFMCYIAAVASPWCYRRS